MGNRCISLGQDVIDLTKLNDPQYARERIQVLHDAADHPHNRAKMVHDGCIQLFIRVAMEHASTADIACEALGLFAGQYAQTLVDAGCLDLIKHGLRKHSLSALSLLSTLVLHASIRSAVLDAGCLPLVVEAMQTSENELLAAHACGILSAYALSSAHHLLLLSLGCAPLITQAMRTHRSCDAVQSNASQALIALASERTNRTALVEAGLDELFKAAILCYPSDHGLLEHLMQYDTLPLNLFAKACRHLFTSLPVPKLEELSRRLIVNMGNNPQDVSFQVEACRCWAAHPEPKHAPLSCIRLIKRAMEAGSATESLQVETCNALCHIAKDIQRAKWMATNCLDLLLGLLRNCSMVQESVLALLAQLAEHAPLRSILVRVQCVPAIIAAMAARKENMRVQYLACRVMRLLSQDHAHLHVLMGAGLVPHLIRVINARRKESNPFKPTQSDASRTLVAIAIGEVRRMVEYEHPRELLQAAVDCHPDDNKLLLSLLRDRSTEQYSSNWPALLSQAYRCLIQHARQTKPPNGIFEECFAILGLHQRYRNDTDIQLNTCWAMEICSRDPECSFLHPTLIERAKEAAKLANPPVQHQAFRALGNLVTGSCLAGEIGDEGILGCVFEYLHNKRARGGMCAAPACYLVGKLVSSNGRLRASLLKSDCLSAIVEELQPGADDRCFNCPCTPPERAQTAQQALLALVPGIDPARRSPQLNDMIVQAAIRWYPDDGGVLLGMLREQSSPADLCLLANRLCHDPPTCGLADLVEILCFLMDQHGKDPEPLAHACDAIRHLATMNVLERSCVNTIAQAMCAHPSCEFLQEQAYWALILLCRAESGAITLVSESKNMQGIIPSLRGSSASALRALSLLSRIGAHECLHQALMQKSCLTAVIGSMARHPTNPEVQANACEVLFLLSKDASNHAALLALNALPPIFRALKTYPSHTGIKRYGSELLIRLASDPVRLQELCARGHAELLQSALFCYPDDHEVLMYLLRSNYPIEPFKEFFPADSLAAQIKSLLHSPNQDDQLAAYRILRRLSAACPLFQPHLAEICLNDLASIVQRQIGTDLDRVSLDALIEFASDNPQASSLLIRALYARLHHNEQSEPPAEPHAQQLQLSSLTSERDHACSLADAYRLHIGCSLGSFMPKCYLGSGSYGVVYLAEDWLFEDHRAVCLKFILNRQMSESATRIRDRYAAELNVLSHLPHHAGIPHPITTFLSKLTYEWVAAIPPGAIQDFEQYTDTQSYMIVMPYCGKTLSSRRPRTFSVAHLVSIFEQLLHILVFLEENGVVHRDIKGNNILVQMSHDGSPRASLIDFGLAHLGMWREYRGAGDVIWGNEVTKPPELQRVRLGDRIDYAKADSYALAKTMYTYLMDDIRKSTLLIPGGRLPSLPAWFLHQAIPVGPTPPMNPADAAATPPLSLMAFPPYGAGDLPPPFSNPEEATELPPPVEVAIAMPRETLSSPTGVMASVLTEMLHPDPQQRLSARDALQRLTAAE
eukprot:gnl/Trimastix_PCT/4094.p1 GENE.gnl/Trimastix_PCT/4094~~gnl/Trimastix_PCT/4094.p1  ORF type:complete len:1492 (+),score=286.80 gnl/Trimastix_PCT/4094:91-4566(+)